MLNRNDLPLFIKNAFSRSSHPFLMWKGINEIPEEIENLINLYLLDDNIRNAKLFQKEYNNVYLIGCGTSYFAAIAGSYYINKMARINIRASSYNAFEFLNNMPLDMNNDLLIAISHTGETACVIDAVKNCKNRGAKIIGITDVKNSPLDKWSDLTLLGTMGREDSLPKTRSYVATLFRLLFISGFIAKLNDFEIDKLVESLKLLYNNYKNMINNYDNIANIADKLSDTKSIYLVGYGANIATINEGALKFHECLQIKAEAWELEEVMHGPWVALNENDLVILLSFKGSAFEKEYKFVNAIKNINPNIWIITNADEYLSGNKYVTELSNISNSFFPDIINSLLYIVPIYQFVYRLSIIKNINPDIMRLDNDNYLMTRLNLPR